MKITIEHQGTKIIVDEDGLKTDRGSLLQYQNEKIQETIIVMTEQVKKLTDSVKE